MHMRFKEWLLLQESASRPGAKQGLYPLGYGGIALYPPSDIINWSADAITYMPKLQRTLKFKWGDDMLSNPNPGERLNFGKEVEGERADGLLNFKYGDGILAKPPGACDVTDIEKENGKPYSSMTPGDGDNGDKGYEKLRFVWGKGPLAKPKGLIKPKDDHSII